LVALGENESEVITSVGLIVPNEKTVADAPAGNHRAASAAAHRARPAPEPFRISEACFAIIPILTLAFSSILQSVRFNPD
jgi:hypothetical protein